ncbi:MAG: FAD-dependent oxidoreductase [Bacteroidetes bacterium]|nr:FAD-dependent oxidoreductase [Bacteroidota bacterium]
MNRQVAVIGAGITGMTAAGALSELGIDVILLEKEEHTGGHVKNWDRLFPSRRPAKEVLDFTGKSMATGVDIRCGSAVESIGHNKGIFTIRPVKGEPVNAMSVVLATGYDLFDARKKEEYGYGIYDNVITSAELETIFSEGKKLTTHQGTTPQRIGIIHCVGSRDEKVGNLYCSKVCCVTGVKQAIEIREMLPGCEVFSFYMDLRMYDRNFEELYFEAQQKWGVSFIRGRLSECAENPDHSLVLKTEDTLTGRPLKMTVDMMILLVGFVPSPETVRIARMLGLSSGPDGFLLPADEHFHDNTTTIPGLFLAGAVKGPACIVNSMADARATAMQVKSYLNGEMLK